MESYVDVNHKRLRRGFTTGTCAAAAACGAAQLLLSEEQTKPCEISILTPKGITVNLPVEEIRMESEAAICSVRKDSGDDPDVTNGALVYAKVMKLREQQGKIVIDGGLGVGRVTKPGLACPVGQAAINPTPRRMIEEEVRRIMNRFGCKDGLFIEISIPDGVKLAEKTFNPKLGIEGGISVLGTSGIVEPMSEQALVDTIKVEINVQKAAGAEYLILTPGNYGETFLKEQMQKGNLSYVKCSNFIGDGLDYIKEKSFKGVLLIGHIGKLVKVAAGVMNTHSKYGDKRMETLAVHIEQLGGESQLVERLRQCVTTEDAISVLRQQAPELETGLWKTLLSKIKEHMEERLGVGIEAEAIIYSNKYGYLGETEGTAEFLLKAEKRK